MMPDAPLHRLYRHYSELPYSQRVLYTAALLVLGMGYLFATIHLLHTHSGRAGGSKWMLAYEDIVIAYTGSGKASRLESALHGPMSSMLPPDEVKLLVDWVQKGTDQARYEKEIKPVLDARCMTCHDGSNPHLKNLKGYDNLKAVAAMDTGADVFTLVRVSHIHLFGLTFIFFITGLMYSHAYVRPVWLKCTVIAMPFAAIIVDVSAWYLTKLYHPFAWAVMAAGGLMALCFAVMWITAMYQMWLASPPAVIAQRKNADVPVDI